MLLISKSVFLCIVILAISISNAKTLYTRSESTETDSVGRTLRKHPGCFIWWFLPGCILGDRVAVDPFGIYPWKKFCRKYSDLQAHDICKGKVPRIRESDEIDTVVEKEINDNEDQLSESSLLTDINSNVKQSDNNLNSYLEHLETIEEQNESNSVLNKIQKTEITKQRPKR